MSRDHCALKSCSIAAGLALFCLAPVLHAERTALPHFASLGDLPGGQFESGATAVSADGSVVVGWSSSSSGETEAFRWQSGIMIGLGDLPGGKFESYAAGISSDGSTIVGYSSSENSKDWSQGKEACVWQDGSLKGLGDLSGDAFISSANSVNADGTIIVGSGFTGTNDACRWQDGDLLALEGLLDGKGERIANGISTDGSLIVGYSASSRSDGFEACAWLNGDAIALGDLEGGLFQSLATDVTPDGSIIVGWATSAAGLEAAIWKDETVYGLGDLAGGKYFSMAFAISADGSTVVGDASTASGREAFIWTLDSGMQNLRDWLVKRGANGLDGWRLGRAYDISDDGQTIVGSGINPDGKSEAWLVSLRDSHGDMDCDMDVSFTDIDPFIAALASREEYEKSYPGCIYERADINGDQSVDFNDIDAFIDCLINGGCP